MDEIKNMTVEQEEPMEEENILKEEIEEKPTTLERVKGFAKSAKDKIVEVVNDDDVMTGVAIAAGTVLTGICGAVVGYICGVCDGYDTGVNDGTAAEKQKVADYARGFNDGVGSVNSTIKSMCKD